MTNTDRILLIVGFSLACGFLLLMAILAPTMLRLMGGKQPPKNDVVGTFQALVATGQPAASGQTSIAATLAVPGAAGTAVPPPPAGGGPGGHIVFTCQIYKYQSSEQICMMNSDGSDY